MYRLYGIPTQNTLKCAYTLDAMGLDYEYQQMDLAKGEHKTDEFLRINPVGKVPALKHNDFNMFESGAICRYIANTENSELYPKEAQARAQADQWMDFFSSHLGRWLSTLFFENVIKKNYMKQEPDQNKCAEALEFVKQQIEPIESHLGKNIFFIGDKVSIADTVAFAFLEQTSAIGFDLAQYPNTQKWFKQMTEMPFVEKTRSKISWSQG